MRSTAFFGLMLAGCSLSACGGSGSVSSTPTPPAAPAQTNATLTNLQYSEAFEGRGAINPFTVNTTTGAATGNGTRTNRQIEIRYNAANNSYTLNLGDRPETTFGITDRVPSQSTAIITVYERQSGATTDNFILFNPGPANTQLALTYATYGGWQTITQNSANVGVNTSFFVFGIKTAPGNMPTSGTARYQTIVDGQFAGSTGVYTLGGTSSFSANFAAGTVAFEMTLLGDNILNSSFKTFGTMSGTGTINSAVSGFEASTGSRAPGTYRAELLGKFYGPSAAEMGASFLITGDDGGGNGVLIGRKN